MLWLCDVNRSGCIHDRQRIKLAIEIEATDWVVPVLQCVSSFRWTSIRRLRSSHWQEAPVISGMDIISVPSCAWVSYWRCLRTFFPSSSVLFSSFRLVLFPFFPSCPAFHLLFVHSFVRSFRSFSLSLSQLLSALFSPISPFVRSFFSFFLSSFLSFFLSFFLFCSYFGGFASKWDNHVTLRSNISWTLKQFLDNKFTEGK